MASIIKRIILQIFSIAKFQNLWIVPAVAALGIYGLGSLVGLVVFSDTAAFRLLGIFALGVGVYLLSYKYCDIRFLKDRSVITLPQAHLRADVWIGIITLLYFVTIGYAVLSAPKIALFEALKGANASEISIARQMLFITRSGPEKLLVYLNAFLSSIFVPYAIAVSFLLKRKYRYVLLTAFVISLTFSLEKALVIKAFLPLVILAVNRWLPKRSGYVFAILMVVMVMSITALSKMGSVGAGVAERGVLSQKWEKKELKNRRLATSGDFSLWARVHDEVYDFIDKISDQIGPLENRFELIDSSSLPGYVVNRILWIPYVTAYDWLLYFDRELDSKYLTGRTSLTVSALTGQQKFNMSGEVFAAEFGSDGTLNTGSSNTIFLVDMFVNFGWWGVAVVAFLLAMMSRLFERLKNPAATACYYYFLYQLMIGSFFGVMFSDGMLLFLLFILIIPAPAVVKEPV